MGPHLPYLVTEDPGDSASPANPVAATSGFCREHLRVRPRLKGLQVEEAPPSAARPDTVPLGRKVLLLIERLVDILEWTIYVVALGVVAAIVFALVVFEVYVCVAYWRVTHALY